MKQKKKTEGSEYYFRRDSKESTPPKKSWHSPLPASFFSTTYYKHTSKMFVCHLYSSNRI